MQNKYVSDMNPYSLEMIDQDKEASAQVLLDVTPQSMRWSNPDPTVPIMVIKSPCFFIGVLVV